MDTFSSYPNTPISPARAASTVTPTDSVELPFVSRALYVGQPGDVSVQMVDGGQTIFEAVPGGSLLPIRVSRVFETGTTAGGIVSLW